MLPADHVETPETTVCYRHPDRPTRLACSRCGRPICGDCVRPAPVGQLCPEDARETVRVRGISGSQLPLATYAILALNGVMLLLQAALSGSVAGLLDPSTTALYRLGGLNTVAVGDQGEYWRLFTVMILHGGLIHFALNSYALYLFGPTLEELLGRWRFLALYVGAGFTGSAASYAVSRPSLAVGASGAIFGLLGALVVFFFRRRRAGGAQQLQTLVVMVVLNLFIARLVPNIDNMAHIGGLVGGMVGMALLEAVGPRRRSAQWLALAAPFVLGVILTVYGTATLHAVPVTG